MNDLVHYVETFLKRKSHRLRLEVEIVRTA